MKNITIIGAGGHSKVIRDIILASQKYKIIAILDDKYKNVTNDKLTIKGPIEYAKNLFENHNSEFVIAVGDNKVRKEIVKLLNIPDSSYSTLVHPTAFISPSVKLGFGVVVMPQALINADSIVGNHVIINSSASVGHDTILGDFVHISPNSTLTGGSQVGEGTQIGAGAVLIPCKQIGEWSMVGAGSTVTKDIPSKCLVVGCPAKVIKENYRSDK